MYVDQLPCRIVLSVLFFTYEDRPPSVFQNARSTYIDEPEEPWILNRPYYYTLYYLSLMMYYDDDASNT